MFSKIFLSVLLLTFVYTYMLISIKDNNNTSFRNCLIISILNQI